MSELRSERMLVGRPEAWLRDLLLDLRSLRERLDRLEDRERERWLKVDYKPVVEVESFPMDPRPDISLVKVEAARKRIQTRLQELVDREMEKIKKEWRV